MKACGFTFFIYLFHEPTLNIIRKNFNYPIPSFKFWICIQLSCKPLDICSNMDYYWHWF